MSLVPPPGEADLAIVIVNFNTGGYLTRCLDSLEAHRDDISLDVLVIDNASSDASHRRAVRAHPWVRLIENRENVYLSPAWNQGARETSAPWLLFLNPDTEWWEGSPADLVEAARTHPGVGMVGPLVRDPDGVVYPSGRPFPSVIGAIAHGFLGGIWPANPFTRRYHMDDWDRTTERQVDWVSGCCMLLARETLDALGGFDEEFPLYGEELDIATRLLESGRTVLFTPAAEVVHEIGVSTGRSRAMLLLHSRSIYRYYRKHRAVGWRRFTLPLARLSLRLRAETEWLRTKAGEVGNR